MKQVLFVAGLLMSFQAMAAQTSTGKTDCPYRKSGTTLTVGANTKHDNLLPAAGHQQPVVQGQKGHGVG